jgi:hypothetical protein
MNLARRCAALVRVSEPLVFSFQTISRFAL